MGTPGIRVPAPLTDPIEFERRRQEFRERLTLKLPDLNLLQNHPRDQFPLLTQNLETLLQERAAQGKLLLPDLTAFNNDALGIFSDYSGEANGNYLTYSVLVCGFRYIGVFTEKMTRIREGCKLAEQEISFKTFRVGRLRAALPAYLAAANELPGFLCTIAVDRRIKTLFGPHLDRSNLDRLVTALNKQGFGRRKPLVAEKLLRVVHLSAYLAALLGSDGQKIFWMSDHDDICANPDHHHSMLALFDNMLRLYAREGVDFPLLGGALPFTPRSVMMNDLLSLADVVAGSVAQYLTKRDSERPETITLKAGAEEVFRFLATEGVGLRKATFLMRLNDQGVIEHGPMDCTLITSRISSFPR